MIKKVFWFTFIIILVSLFLLWRALNTPASDLGQNIKFSVTKGESVKQISQNLAEVDLIKFSLIFRYYIWRRNAPLQAGNYLLNSKMTIKEVAEILIKGEGTSDEIVIRIIEGWDINNIDSYFKKNNLFTDDSFVKLSSRELSGWQFKFNKPEFLTGAPDTANLEGFLFPDTYRIYQTASAEEVIKKLLDNFDKKLDEQTRQAIAKQNKSIFEIITMASIIEKEARTLTDMKIVAGIFWDRLKNRIPLQSDATLSYIFNDNKPQHSLEETKINSPYNTYQNLGLPPGPICNPGLNAITAAIYPEYTDYNYFLHKLDTGETIFSKTLEEHNINKAKYLK